MVKKALKKAQVGGTSMPKDPKARVKFYESKGWKKDNPAAIKYGKSPSDTVNTQWISKGKDLIGINTSSKKKVGGAVKSKKKK